jgi:hypothetical protein
VSALPGVREFTMLARLEYMLVRIEKSGPERGLTGFAELI